MIRHLLSIADLTGLEINRFIELTAKCKKGGARLAKTMAGTVVALVFEKSSTRTRLACEVACRRLGAAPLTISGTDLQIGRGETIEDTAKVFSRFVDAICWRTTGHDRLTRFAQSGSIPVINTLSDLEHPCQILADLFTIREHSGRKSGWPSVAFIGDGGNNVANSWLLAAGLLGMDFRLATPPGFVPDAGIMDKARASARRTGGKIMVTPDPVRAALGAGVLYTDVWVSMGQDAEREKRLKLFRGYQINSHLLRQAAPGAKVMHCLPAHRGEEITDSVMDGDQSIVFDQAENRLYNAMAALLWCCRGGKS